MSIVLTPTIRRLCALPGTCPIAVSTGPQALDPATLTLSAGRKALDLTLGTGQAQPRPHYHGRSPYLNNPQPMSMNPPPLQMNTPPPADESPFLSMNQLLPMIINHM